ncbi:MAG: VWA domain-containing protein, partial [Deltaproteobacteria bacterium]|nr:VWA domain-containing protein [Deltaproteobacteria bacterium]
MVSYSLAEPYWLCLILLIIPVLMLSQRRRPQLFFPPGFRIQKLPTSLSRRWLGQLDRLLRCLAILSLIVAMAGPRSGRGIRKKSSNALDMMLIVDTSGSMRAMDFTEKGQRVSRLRIAKTVLKEFIRNRPDDRMGLTIFGTHATAWVPMTLDHDVLTDYLDQAEPGLVGEATAIGDALGIATNRLKDLDAKSKVIILLTDGANSAGTIDPDDAARIAQTLGVRVYTIGVGKDGPVPFPTPFGPEMRLVEMDEDQLRRIADVTGGRYFRADSSESLSDVYSTIDQLE